MHEKPGRNHVIPLQQTTTCTPSDIQSDGRDVESEVRRRLWFILHSVTLECTSWQACSSVGSAQARPFLTRRGSRGTHVPLFNGACFGYTASALWGSCNQNGMNQSKPKTKHNGASVHQSQKILPTLGLQVYEHYLLWGLNFQNWWATWSSREVGPGASP